MKKLIEFCSSNLSVAGSSLVKEFVAEQDQCQVKEYDCLGYCFDCAEQPYAVVDQQVIQASSPDELLQLVKDELNKKS
ncbi:hypothetical protein ADL26_05420 [Thermoactinomyces vulgaris]|nr:hypothetical protein ADL26_05420 [Thermoactinomyces vulgaris]